jgi:hypothetical protein
MAIIDNDRGRPRIAILEDFSSQTGHLLFVNSKGIHLDLPKSLEPTSHDPTKLYLGHTLDEVINSPTDLLADQILAKARRSRIRGRCLGLPSNPQDLYSFVGTNAPWTRSASYTELLMYSVMAHNYTRGTWMAPETRPTFNDTPAAPFCTPAQLVVPLMTKWMLIFEDAALETLWVGKAAPREWFDDSKTTSISLGPTRCGRIGYSINSHLKQRNITATVQLGPHFPTTTKLRLRTPGKLPLKSVSLNGKPWTQFSVEEETITIPPNAGGTIKIVAEYE